MNIFLKPEFTLLISYYPINECNIICLMKTLNLDT